MAVTLPTSPAPRAATPKLRRAGTFLRPANGGPIQRIGRLGSRYAVDFVFPPMTKAQAGPFIAALLETDTDNETLVARLPQPSGASAGSPQVNGAGQGGSSLTADGFTAGITLAAGTAFSFQAGGRHYLHLLKADAVVNGSGQATLAISPMMRVSPGDNAALEFANPVLEGFVEGEEMPWDVDTAGHYHIAFTLYENE